MCNLYASVIGQAAIIAFTRAMRDTTGNLRPLPGIFPDKMAPIVRNAPDGVRELMMARWGMPTPPSYLKGDVDGGVTNIRNTKSPHWRRWLKPDARCVVPFTSFCEYAGAKPPKTPTWFALDDSRPLAFFAGVWTQWRGKRPPVKAPEEGEHTLFGFLMTDPNKEVAAVHPKAMPVILTTPAEIEQWMTAPVAEVLQLQRPLPDGALKIVASGKKEDGLAA